MSKTFRTPFSSQGLCINRIIGDARAWGYRPLSYDRNIFEPLPDDEGGLERFKLFLLGYGELQIPKSLEHVVEIKTGLDYSEFYQLMQNMDIVIPAFSGDACEANLSFHCGLRVLTINNLKDYEKQASSTVAMAVECNVSLQSY